MGCVDFVSARSEGLGGRLRAGSCDVHVCVLCSVVYVLLRCFVGNAGVD